LNSGTPTDGIQPPKVGGEYLVDEAVLEGIFGCSTVRKWLRLLMALVLPIEGI
jgi:hypothetical protein